MSARSVRKLEMNMTRLLSATLAIPIITWLSTFLWSRSSHELTDQGSETPLLEGQTPDPNQDSRLVSEQADVSDQSDAQEFDTVRASSIAHDGSPSLSAVERIRALHLHRETEAAAIIATESRCKYRAIDFPGLANSIPSERRGPVVDTLSQFEAANCGMFELEAIEEAQLKLSQAQDTDPDWKAFNEVMSANSTAQDKMREMLELISSDNPEVRVAALNAAIRDAEPAPWDRYVNAVTDADSERGLELQYLARTLTRCRDTKMCGPNGVAVLEHCLEQWACRPGESMEQYLQRRYSGEELAAVRTVATEMARLTRKP